MKILDVDIETAPNQADLWQLWGNQNVSLNQLRQSSYMLCWAARWEDSREIIFGAEWTGDFVSEIWHLLNECDAVVTYNGDRFDLPTLNKEFILYGLGPPSPYRSIDLYKTVKRQFRFPSNKLAYVVEELSIGKKVDTGGHELWVKVMAGDPVAQKRMETYCKRDTKLLLPLKKKLLPWIPNLPNLNLYGIEGCPGCGKATELQKRGYSYTQQGQYQRLFCTGCRRWFRGTQRLDKVDVI